MAQNSSGGSVKGFKVTNGLRKRLIGVACSSLKELKFKGCHKLKMESDKRIDVLLSDGTIVNNEAYFQTLPSQTLLILRKPGEKVARGVDIVFAALKSFNVDLLQTATQVREFFQHDDDAQRKIKILSQLLAREKETLKGCLSRRYDDPEWFEDLETYADTKEAYMRKRSSGRIQRYFYDARDKVRNSLVYNKKLNAKNQLDFVFNEFQCQLQRDEFFACLFDRSRAQLDAICDENGIFTCQGLWNSDKCQYVTDHTINPYCSKEQRVIFTTWNLDHRVERSRVIVPSILYASEVCCQSKTYQINVNYFYELLFTMKNLKLVHIVCHDKNEHKSATCDSGRIVIQPEDQNAIIKNKRQTHLNNDVRFKKSKRGLGVRS